MAGNSNIQIRVTLILSGLFIAFFFAAHAQLKPTADTNSIIRIIYPPLTQKEGRGIRLPVPPFTHPRLYLTQKDIPTLNQKWNSAVIAFCVEKIKNAAAFSTDGFLKIAGDKSNLDLNVRNAIEAWALFYVLQKDETSGRKSITALLNFYATLKFDHSKQDICRDIGRAIVTGAIVYDWCYPLLTAEQKELLIGRMETLAKQLEVEWPKLVQGSVTGHGTEAQLSRDMLSCGVATYNEKPEIYNRVAGRIIAEFAPVRKAFYPAGYHHQGSAYGPYRFGWDIWAAMIFDKIGYPNVFGKDIAKAPYYFIYSRRPDGQLFRNGDDFLELFTPFGKYWNIGGSMEAYAGSFFKDPILINEALEEGNIGKGPDYLFDFLFFDPSVQPSNAKASLPLTKYFPEPFGAMIARTGWDEGLTSSTAMAEMKIGVYNYVNHQHLDAGSFQLYYKGPLAVQSGIYQGTTGGYGSAHFKAYSQRTIAHNSMLVYDSSQVFKAWSGTVINDGGQRYPAKAAEAKTGDEILSGGYKTGEVLAHSFGPSATKPEYSYLKGELALAYGPKVKSFLRSFVFLNMNDAIIPAVLIVFNKVEAANKAFKKTWLLHCVEEPVIDGINTFIKRTEKGYGGSMRLTTLLPDLNNVSIKKIGGAGNEFTVGGKNYPQSAVNSQTSIDSAMWRIEVSPKEAATTDLFLNVMQVTDATTAKGQLLKVDKIESANMIGVQLGDRLVFFGKNGLMLKNKEQFIIKGDKNYKVLITDVADGEWMATDSEGNQVIGTATKENHCLYFNLKAGIYQLAKKI